MQYMVKVKRFLTIFFALLALAGAVSAQGAAQDKPLALPQAPDADAPAVGFVLAQPVNGNILSPLNGPNFEQYVTWHRVTNAQSYVLKFKDVQTGLVRTKFVTDMEQDNSEFYCDAFNCRFNAVHSAFVGSLVNGHEYKVWVIAKLKNGTSQATPKVKVIAQPVAAPYTLLPFSGESVPFTGTISFSWTYGPDAANYTLIVRDPATGYLVYKGKFQANQYCSSGPVLSLCSADVNTGDFTVGKTYKWFVKAAGLYDGTAKSAKATFSTIFDQE